MKKDVIEVSIKGVMPTSNGCAVFLGDDMKTFVIHVDPSLGQALTAALNTVQNERPMTHDLIQYLFKGLGIDVERVVINDVDRGTFYARLIVSMCNELGTKVVEIDARPSDCMVIAMQAEKPIYVARSVYEGVEDMTEVLQRLLSQEG